MRHTRSYILAFTLGFLSTTLTLSAQTEDVSKSLDLRYCGSPVRELDGSIKRSTAELNLFKLVHQCPSTGKTAGPCPGWAIDHVIPLACGGCDLIHNMQWLPDQIKSTSSPYSKDRWERRVYAAPVPYPSNGQCVNETIVFPN